MVCALRAWMKEGKIPQINLYQRPSLCFPISQLCSPTAAPESESSCTLNTLLPLKYPPPLLVFLLALPNGLMDWGCIGGTHVCRDSRVIIDSLREDVWNASHCKLHSLLCSPAGFIKEAVRHSKTPPPLCNQILMPSHWLIALIVIIHTILRMCASVWDLIAITFKTQRLVKKNNNKNTVAKQ